MARIRRRSSPMRPRIGGPKEVAAQRCLTSATSFGPPILGRIGDERRRIRATAGLAAVLAGTAALWATVLALLPDTAGRQLLGDTWPVAADLLPATGSQYAAMAVGTCGLLALRMLDPRTTLAIQIVFSLTSVAFLAGGYVVGGVPGAAWGLFLGSLCKAAATWIRVARLRPGTPLPEPRTSAPTPCPPLPERHDRDQTQRGDGQLPRRLEERAPQQDEGVSGDQRRGDGQPAARAGPRPRDGQRVAAVGAGRRVAERHPAVLAPTSSTCI
ncbi:hypothetical protein SBADM41S_00789 [Streptomyces badius]